MALEQFGRQDELRALARGLANEPRNGGDILLDGVGEGELQSGDGQFWQGCSPTSSLRGAQRRSNPGNAAEYGLLPFARNDG
jgi:hypothetical protein